jgi:hypothetical protein
MIDVSNVGHRVEIEIDLYDKASNSIANLHEIINDNND